MRIRTLFTGAICVLFSIPISGNGSSLEHFADKAKSVCEVKRDILYYDGKSVTIEGWAQAALHQFRVALSDASCPNMHIFLWATKESLSNADLKNLIIRLYPHFPEGEDYLDDKVHVLTEGKIVREYSGDILTTYIDVKSISVLDDKNGVNGNW